MNYRHAYHGGNFADCMKHALLVWLVTAMARKEAGFFVLDTHAGPGRTDLTRGPAQRTGEWRSGILRLLEAPPAPLQRYVSLVRAEGLYPGSPVLIRALLRAQDRLACCELHPEEAAALRRTFAGDRSVAIHHRDGFEALGALLPPAERRGLILIDPPFEQPDEFNHLLAGLGRGQRRFASGVFAAWYPIKHLAPVRRFHAALSDAGIRDVVSAELFLRAPLDPARLNGCGLAVINPPYRFETEAGPILDALARRLGTGEEGQGTVLRRLADE